jgi:uncharacterized integral membrane protein
MMRSGMSTTPPREGTAAQTRPATRDKPAKRDHAFEARTGVAVLIAVLLVAFAVANSQKVEVDFLVTTAEVPLVIVIVISVLLGAVLGAYTTYRSHRPLARAARRAAKQPQP